MKIEDTIFIEEVQKRYELLTDTYISLYNNALKKFKNETIHDLRVCSRRIITLVEFALTKINSVYGENLIKILKFYFKKLSKLRDIQILQENNKAKAINSKNWLAFINYLVKQEKKTIKKLQSLFSQEKLTEIEGLFFFFELEMRKALNNGAIKAKDLVEAINEKYKQVMIKYNQIEISDIETIHKFRIKFKKFRYLYEFLQQIDAENSISSKELGKYQTLLGDIQDSEILNRSILVYLKKTGKYNQASELLSDAAGIKTAAVLKFIEKKNEIYKFWVEQSETETN
ncbi:MAG TPA: CHAD domain-containing protein [Candidatus Kapabacteria bacterium]|jgi:CHAD domain-containing protein|nr:CHAD domain-containing protein [Candidatus Kapabacteria bacterium]HPU24064.1 CHAD domain-containing protein [Candidatus Kapabacteria bacterium]